MDQLTICGCLLLRLTKQCPFKPHPTLDKRENTKQMTMMSPLQNLKEEKQPNHQRRRDKNTTVLRVKKMKEERKPEGQEKKNAVKTKKGNIGISVNTKAGIDAKQMERVVTLSSDDGELDVAGTLDEQDVKTSIARDLCCRDVKFAAPRRLLADARLPIVDHKIQFSAIKSLGSDQVDVITQDPLTADQAPTLSVITESMDALLKTKRKGRRKQLEFSCRVSILWQFHVRWCQNF